MRTILFLLTVIVLFSSCRPYQSISFTMTDLQTPSGTETAEKKKAREEYKTKVESILYNVVSKNGKREEAYVTIYEGKIMAYGSKRRINKAMVVAAGLTTAAATVTRYKTEWLKN